MAAEMTRRGRLRSFGFLLQGSIICLRDAVSRSALVNVNGVGEQVLPVSAFFHASATGTRNTTCSLSIYYRRHHSFICEERSFFGKLVSNFISGNGTVS